MNLISNNSIDETVLGIIGNILVFSIMKALQIKAFLKYLFETKNKHF